MFMKKNFAIAEHHILKLTAYILAAQLVVACGSSASDNTTIAELPDTIKVEIRRTAFGVPHIVGKDLRSAAYGMAYAYAQDNVCVAADRFLTVAGERSKYLGPDGAGPGANLRSDFYYRNILDQATIDKAFPGASSSSVTSDALAGYVAGYNRFLADAKPAEFGDCSTLEWAKRLLNENDLKRHLLALATQSGAGAFIAAIADATPPPGLFPTSQMDQPLAVTMVKSKHLQMAQLKRTAAEFSRQFDARPMGSNGQAFGSELSENGKGILIGNPHFPWSGILRFYQAHVQVPGQYNVMGASVGGVPLPQIGFNNDLAWTNTVSTGRRLTLFELPLSAGNYLVDGVAKPIMSKKVTVDVLSNGVLTPQTRSYYSTEYGPILVSAPLGAVWTSTKAYAIRDANLDNGRIIDQMWEMGRATSTEELRQVMSKRMALPWVNTLAADRAGNALYADYSVTPNVDAAHLAKCAKSVQAKTLAASRTYLLDGSTAACNWPVDSAAATPGIMSATALPYLARKDYVGNHNESAWLANPAQLLTGFSPLVGDQIKPQSLRTRMGFIQIQERLAGTDGWAGTKVSPDKLEATFFQSRMLSAELVLPSLLTLCQTRSSAPTSNGNMVDLTQACSILSSWDRRAKISSVGTPIFREFWRKAQSIPGLFATPFSATAAITTPRDPAISTPAVANAMMTALADSVLALNNAGVPLNAALGSVQYVTRNGVKLPFDGGDEFEGVYNKMTPPGLTAGGYTSVVSGSSYIQIVSFESSGVLARGLLTYSQSSNSGSPYFSDQTQQLSTGKFVKLPYTEAEIKADSKLSASLILTVK